MQFLDIHTHNESRDTGVEGILSLSLTGDIPQIPPDGRFVSLGLHPWFATLEHLDTDYNRLAARAKNPEVKLIGECGLDRLKGEKLENQLIILKKQMKLAEELGKPVILHCVSYFDELMSLKKDLKPTVPLIIHGFNKSEELGKQLMNKGFYLSVGKAILNPHSGAAALLKQTDVFFLETDDAGYGIEEIYRTAANLKNTTVEALKALIFASWKKIKLI